MAQRKTLNRSVLVVVPKQPYYDWGNQVFRGTDVDAFSECWSCLLDDDWDAGDVERYLKSNYDAIFRELLQGMCTFPEAWPEHRSWALFNQWFDWHYSSLVWDFLPDKRIRREAF